MGLILADTNIVIYAIKGISAVEPYLDHDLALSDISVIELLGVKNIEKNSLLVRKKFIENFICYPVNYSIRQTAIELKQQYILKIPDAIIAATAICFDIPFITADKDFKKIKELEAVILSV